MESTPSTATQTQMPARRPLHWDALAVLRALAESGTAKQVSARVKKAEGVTMSPNRVTFLLDHLVGCYHALRQGHGEAAIYVRQAPGERAVQDDAAQRAAARGDGVLS